MPLAPAQRSLSPAARAMASAVPARPQRRPARHPGRPALTALGAMTVGALLLAACNRQQALTYETAPVTQGDLVTSLSATGPITNPQSIALGFKSSGKLAEMNVALGD